MTRSFRSITLHGITIAGLLLLAACGKDEPATPANPPAAASTATPPAATVAAPAIDSSVADVASASSIAAPETVAADAPLTVAGLTLGSAVNAEYQVTDPGTSFATNDKSIYASVATEGHSSGATLNAKWSYLEGKGQLVSSISQSIATDGPATTTFKVQNPDLWPEGKYQVEISLDGKPVTKQEFQIRKS